tara:strand:+ start:290 stop:655 length:366 start_codon:yes stop_codon:yes gene_type:complete
MKEKRFRSITEVSKLLGINSHVIRYWDSKFDGLSTRNSFKGQRFFNKENIKKLQNLKLTLINERKHNYSPDLEKKILRNQNKNIKINSNANIAIDYNSKRYNNFIRDLIEIRRNLIKILES